MSQAKAPPRQLELIQLRLQAAAQKGKMYRVSLQVTQLDNCSASIYGGSYAQAQISRSIRGILNPATWLQWVPFARAPPATRTLGH